MPGIDKDAANIDNVTINELAAAPATPPSAKARLYKKADGFYGIDDGGVETLLGSAGGQVNTSWWNNINSSSRLWGGLITDNGDGTVAVAQGEGLVKADDAGPEDVPTSINDGQASALSLVSWSAVPSLALTDEAYNFIYWDNSAAQIAATTNFSSISFTQDFTLGRAWRSGNVSTVRLCGMNTWNFNRRSQLFGDEFFGVVRANGVETSETGTRNIAISAGVMWAELVNRFTITASDTSGADTFTYWYRDGVGGWTEVASQTQIDNLQYDDGDGTLGTLTANRYGVHWVYVVHDSSVHVVYGQGDYTLLQAQNSATPAALPGIIASYATLSSRVIIQKSAATFAEIDSAFDQVLPSGSVTQHGDLAGLQGGTTSEYYHLTLTEYNNLGGMPFNARLSLESNVAVSTSEQLAATSIHLVPFKGNHIALYDGSTKWDVFSLSSQITDTLANYACSVANVAYDFFVYDSSGLTMEAVAWKSVTATNNPAAGSSVVINLSDTTGVAVGDLVTIDDGTNNEVATVSAVSAGVSITVATLVFSYTLPDVFYNSRGTALAIQDGVYVKTGELTKRYVGTIRTTAADTTEMRYTNVPSTDPARILVWNYYNRVSTKVLIFEDENSWTKSASGWRNWSDNANNRVNLIVGVSEDVVKIDFAGTADDSGNAVNGVVGIGLDDTANFVGLTGWLPTLAAVGAQYATARYQDYLQGYHFLACIEYSSNSNTITFFGDAGLAFYQNGAYVTIWA